jgi:hypothetical protein
MPKVRTHYNNLKVARNAPSEVIQAAFKSLSQKYHPDRNPGDQKAARIMAIINRAYEVLSDPVKRQHDEWIARADGQNYTESPLQPEVDVESPPQSEVYESRPSSRIPRWLPRFRFAPVAKFQLLGTIILVVAITLWRVMSGNSVTTRQPSPAILLCSMVIPSSCPSEYGEGPSPQFQQWNDCSKL